MNRQGTVAFSSIPSCRLLACGFFCKQLDMRESKNFGPTDATKDRGTHAGLGSNAGSSIHRSADQLHNSLAGGNSEQVGIDGDGGALLPPPELDAALDPDTAPDP
jgi:hypothetical protein